MSTCWRRFWALKTPAPTQGIDFVGGARGLEELERRVNSGGASVAIALHPTPMQALMDVAGAGEIMPPKSTLVRGPSWPTAC